jgi:hypothetical protein
MWAVEFWWFFLVRSSFSFEISRVWLAVVDDLVFGYTRRHNHMRKTNIRTAYSIWALGDKNHNSPTAVMNSSSLPRQDMELCLPPVPIDF